MAKGQIRKALSGFYYVYAAGETYQTRGRGNFRKRNITPLVGDYVEFESTNLTDGYVLDILPRHNQLVRPAVANVDQGVIVMSSIEPNFSANLLDRFLVTLEYAGIRPLIYLTKIDLLSATAYAEMEQVKANYEKIGYPVILPTPTNNESSLSEISAYFPNNLTVFVGQTGAGKSTLLNSISPELDLATGEISTSLGRGRHTTRHVELIPLNGGLVGDTPGFSAIEFSEITATELSGQFPEINRAAEGCKFRECKHLHEPKCQVKEQVTAGEILQTRYDHYLQYLNEIEGRKPIYGKNKK